VIRPTCAVLVGLAVGSCGTDPDRHAVEVRDVVGLWHVNFTPDAGCTRTNPTTALDLDLQVLSPIGADIVTLRGGWEFAPVTDPNRSLEGTLDLRTGAFHADLVSAAPSAQARLEGSIATRPEIGLALMGSLTDPASGTGPGIFGTGSCTYTAAGQH
jgi:hypothetical protein